MASLTDSTIKQYTAPLKRWWNFCNNLDRDPYNGNTELILTFLTEWFNEGASYGTLNSARSAISLISLKPLTENATISRFFKGIYKLRPSLPRYSTTWNSEIILKEAAKFEPIESLSLRDITEKLIILLAMGTGHRVQSLSLISIDHIKIEQSGIEIKIVDLIKTSRPGAAQPNFFIPFFNNNPKICLSRTISRYLEVTKELRNKYKRLILNINKPHKPASTQTICRWLKNILKRCNLEKYSAHSTRHAATSEAFKKGLDLGIIKSTAGWSNESKVFARFYNRPILADRGSFATTILDRSLD